MKTILKLFGTFLLLLSPLFFYISWVSVLSFSVFATISAIVIFDWAKFIKRKNLFYATGSKHHRYSPVSQPYIISITAGPNDVENVEILDAAVGQFNNNHDKDGVTFKYMIPGITYRQFLAAVASGNPLQIQQLRLSARHDTVEVAIDQVQETVILTQKDLNGNQLGKPIFPSLDSYQYTQTIIDEFIHFHIDALTSLVIKKLYANTSLKIYLYPALKEPKVQNEWDSVFGYIITTKKSVSSAIKSFRAWFNKLIKKNKSAK